VPTSEIGLLNVKHLCSLFPLNCESWAKFSALKDRAQNIGQFLAGEAEVLPVVFTRADPPESVFETAINHGVALVGGTVLKSLFGMLSAATREEDALSFLKKQKSPPPWERAGTSPT
jgi:hypothetical protein